MTQLQTPHEMPRSESRLRRARRAGSWMLAAALLASCSLAPRAPSATAASAPPPALAKDTDRGIDQVATGDLVEPRPVRRAPLKIEELRTRNARFRVTPPEDLPGWAEDDLGSTLQTLRHSCTKLQSRTYWLPLCQESDGLRSDTPEVRAFFEREFTFLRVMAPDAKDEGDITGYFEPMLAGSRRRTAAFNVPVYATPNDLLTLDWTKVPRAQRKGVVGARVQGRSLRVVPAGEPGAMVLDLSAFTLDTREKRLRLRAEAGRLVPYYTREQIQARGGLDAPVIAWVDDALGLYAMQVQGSGRIRLDDGNVLRIGFAEQNGHPFRPLRVAAAAPRKPRVVTRGAAPEPEEAMQFDFEDEAAPADGAAAADEVTDDDAEDDVATRGRPARRTARKPSAQSSAQSDALVDQLLADGRRARKPAAATSRKRTSPVTATRLAQDPSYVFFRVADDQGVSQGPRGAMGVPLTPERSIAVDPRVTPLGYPVFLAAKPPRAGAPRPMQKLVFAQDTGGAIRGAVRADHFWGHGAEAARAARSTKLRGEMWLIMPSAEFRAMKGRRLVLRGSDTGVEEIDRECLVADEDWCAEDE